MSDLIQFIESFFNEMRIHSHILTKPFAWDINYDLQLRYQLTRKKDYIIDTFPSFSPDEADNCILIIKDTFGCQYILIPIPNSEDKLLIGPFSFKQYSTTYVDKIMKKLSIPDTLHTYMNQYYQSLPCIGDKNTIDIFLASISRSLYGKRAKEVIYRNPNENPVLEISNSSDLQASDDTIEIIEKRYELENKFMYLLSIGDYESIDKLTSSSYSYIIEKRLPDTLRDKKNYLIILNTLSRKAAEQAEIHPLYLDEISSRFAYKIEDTKNMKEVKILRNEMIKKYCLLVKNNSCETYSYIIKKAINKINFNLEKYLSLSIIAKELSISKSYLSALFKKETGSSITKYIAEKRIDKAIFLLNTSKKQIGDIALACGYDDLTYFSKRFKKIKGISPSQYKKMINKNSN